MTLLLRTFRNTHTEKVKKMFSYKLNGAQRTQKSLASNQRRA
jgi:hypothetical protein